MNKQEFRELSKIRKSLERIADSLDNIDCKTPTRLNKTVKLNLDADKTRFDEIIEEIQRKLEKKSVENIIEEMKKTIEDNSELIVDIGTTMKSIDDFGKEQRKKIEWLNPLEVGGTYNDYHK